MADAAFARVSGMPPEYFEKTAERYPSDQSALRVFLALRTAARRVDNTVGGWLDPSGLTVTKFDVLHLLAAAAPGGATVGRLRESLRMTQPNVSFVMTSLERERYVKRSSDPDDGRSSIFRITKAGLAVLDELTPIHLRSIGVALRDVSEADRRRLIELLATIAEGFEGAVKA